MKTGFHEQIARRTPLKSICPISTSQFNNNNKWKESTTLIEKLKILSFSTSCLMLGYHICTVVNFYFYYVAVISPTAPGEAPPINHRITWRERKVRKEKEIENLENLRKTRWPYKIMKSIKMTVMLIISLLHRRYDQMWHFVPHHTIIKHARTIIKHNATVK